MFARTICWLLLALCPILSQADELTPEKREDIKKLLTVTGSSRIALQMTEAFSQSLARTLKAARPDIPERVFTVLNKELISLFEEKMAAPGGMMDQMVPIYDKYFTHAEIKELLAFYQTDVGRKIIDVLPRVTAESMAAGQAWGQSLGPEVIRRVNVTLKKEGIELPRNKSN